MFLPDQKRPGTQKGPKRADFWILLPLNEQKEILFNLSQLASKLNKTQDLLYAKKLTTFGHLQI